MSLTYYDLSDLNKADLSDHEAAVAAWDEVQFAASVQGNVNRDEPRLFLRCMPETDDFWWQYLREDHGWLADAEVREIAFPEELLELYAEKLRGGVIYNADLPFASNIAATIAGAENRFTIRYDENPESLYRRLKASPYWPDDVVEIGLSGEDAPQWEKQYKTGSAKNNAYRWALENYLEAGKSGNTDLAYFLDAWWLKEPAKTTFWNSTLANHDFYIAKRAFFFDLNPMPDEVPIDELSQQPGTDRKTLELILKTMYERADGGIYAVGGFIPWKWKYVGPDGGSFAGVGGKQHPVHCEWEFSKLISAYNGYKNADALSYSGMANASFYQHFPLEEHYPQRQPDISTDALTDMGLLDEQGNVIPRNYFTFYCGDYDASAWLNRFVPEFWVDPKRGTLPLNWAFNPNLARRAPQAMHYAREKAKVQDYFWAGDNGAGYLNPGMLTAPRLDPSIPDGWDAWIAHNKPWFEQFDLSMTGFLIDGTGPSINEYGFSRYAEFSPAGVGTQLSKESWGVSPEGVPYAWVRDVGHIANSVEEGVQRVDEEVAEGLRFRILRTILNSPTWHAEVVEGVESKHGETVHFVSAPVFFELIRREKLASRDMHR